MSTFYLISTRRGNGSSIEFFSLGLQHLFSLRGGAGVGLTLLFCTAPFVVLRRGARAVNHRRRSVLYDNHRTGGERNVNK